MVCDCVAPAMCTCACAHMQCGHEGLHISRGLWHACPYLHSFPNHDTDSNGCLGLRQASGVPPDEQLALCASCPARGMCASSPILRHDTIPANPALSTDRVK
eukprot:366025-Chlamydomonas_euryale.AAC.13